MNPFLHKVPFFQELSPEQLERVSAICARKGFKAGTVLFREKEQGDVFYIILSGSVKVYTNHTGGEEKIMSVFQAGDSFGELSLIDGKPRSASAQVLEDSAFLTIRGSDFLALLQEQPDISVGIMRELCRRLRDTNNHVYDLTFLDARTRVIKNLITLANRHGTRSGNLIHIRMMLNHEELARMAGVSRNILSQVLRDFEALKMLTVSHDSFTLDLSKLR